MGDEKIRSVHYVVMCDRQNKTPFAIGAHASTCVQPVAVIPSICLIFLDFFILLLPINFCQQTGQASFSSGQWAMEQQLHASHTVCVRDQLIALKLTG